MLRKTYKAHAAELVFHNSCCFRIIGSLYKYILAGEYRQKEKQRVKKTRIKRLRLRLMLRSVQYKAKLGCGARIRRFL